MHTGGSDLCEFFNPLIVWYYLLNTLVIAIIKGFYYENRRHLGIFLLEFTH